MEDADQEILHDLLLANLTTHPHYHPRSLGLGWMQRHPEQWPGHHTRMCVEVSDMLDVFKMDKCNEEVENGN